MRDAFRRMIWTEKIPAEPGKQIQSQSSIFQRRLACCILATALVVLLQSCSRFDTQGEPQATRASRASVTYIGTWGMKGSEPGEVDQPTSIAVDVLGNSYIPDIGTQFIHKFDARGTPLLAFQDPPLAHPQSIAVDRGGAIYVSDPSRNSVFVYFPNGDRYREIHLPGRGNRENVLSVAVDDDGIIYVFDSAEGKVFSYTSRFKLVHTWQPFGNSPNSRGRDGAIASGSDGYLYLADPVGNDIMRIMGNGSVSLVIHASADGVNRKLSAQFAAANKHVFVMDADGRMLHIWTNDGKPVLDADLAPELGQGSRYPPALAVSPRGELLVLDDRETRVLRYKISF